MLQITSKGLVIERLDEIHTRLSEGFKSIYGEDINIDADTPDGQMIGLFSQSLSDINEVIAFLFQMLDPYRATGEWLEQRALYAGVIRRGAEYSYIRDAAVIGQANITVPEGAVFSDTNRNRWVTTQEVPLNSLGSGILVLRSESLGAFTLSPGEELSMETVIVGVDRVTLLTEADPGIEEETDGQLLIRFMQSHAINNNDDREGIRAALAALSDVKKVSVIENYTGELDTDTGVPAHSMNAIVLGGNDSDIAMTLLRKKIGGCAFMGTQKMVIDHLGATRTVLFDRPEEVRVSVRLVLRRLTGFTDIDEEGIKSALESTDFDIGENIYAMRLICQVNSVSGFVILSITVNGGDSVGIGVRQYAKIYAGDVEVLIE